MAKFSGLRTFSMDSSSMISLISWRFILGAFFASDFFLDLALWSESLEEEESLELPSESYYLYLGFLVEALGLSRDESSELAEEEALRF